MVPGRRIIGGSEVRSSTVDSRPTAVGPLSRIRSIRPERSLATCAAEVGEIPSDRLALGRGDRPPEACDQVARDHRPGDAERDRRPARGDDVGDAVSLGQDEGERPRPEALRQPLGQVGPGGRDRPGRLDRSRRGRSAGWSTPGPWRRRSRGRPPRKSRRRRGRRRSPSRTRRGRRRGGSRRPRRSRRGPGPPGWRTGLGSGRRAWVGRRSVRPSRRRGRAA